MGGLLMWLFVTAVSFSGAPASVDQAQDFEVDTTLTCTSCTGDSYLRGVFYPSGTSYFGFTQDNSGAWVNVSGGSCTQYYKIAVSDLKDGSWSGKLKVKIDKENGLFSGPGDYLFKIGRYTASCGSPTWSTETTVAITGPTATPTSAPTNSPTPTPANTATPTPPKIPSPTPSPTLMPTFTPTQSATESMTPEILGVVDPPATAEAVVQTHGDKSIALSLAFIGTGLGILSFAIYLQKRDGILRK